MNSKWLIVVGAVVLLGGCTTVPSGAIPVVEAGGPAGKGQGSVSMNSVSERPGNSDAVVMVPQTSSVPELQTFPDPVEYSMPMMQNGVPTGIPSSTNDMLAADEQLDGPVLALLTTARQQRSNGDLGGAASSLERAQRIAPREPQVLYHLAEIRLTQGNTAQAEQLARRGLTYAAGRPAIQAGLWELIAQARERQGDPAGAAQARSQARVGS